jgi:hypothetical protein
MIRSRAIAHCGPQRDLCIRKLANLQGMRWMMDVVAQRPKLTNQTPGLVDMLCGATQHSNTDPFDRTSPARPRQFMARLRHDSRAHASTQMLANVCAESAHDHHRRLCAYGVSSWTKAQDRFAIAQIEDHVPPVISHGGKRQQRKHLSHGVRDLLIFTSKTLEMGRRYSDESGGLREG